MRLQPAAKAERPPDHRLAVRVYYEDTDAAGIVYYANYLKFAERGRTEMMRALGAEPSTWREETGLFFVVQRCHADYRQPARLDDDIEVRTFITRVGAASLSARQEVHRGDTLLVSMEVRLAMVDHEMKPARLPKALIAALTPQYEAGNDA
ncbi:MAG: tol-pal system-associated acyl-CoA thioesterase [Pseudomonadota bacterium]